MAASGQNASGRCGDRCGRKLFENSVLQLRRSAAITACLTFRHDVRTKPAPPAPESAGRTKTSPFRKPIPEPRMKDQNLNLAVF